MELAGLIFVSYGGTSRSISIPVIDILLDLIVLMRVIVLFCLTKEFYTEPKRYDRQYQNQCFTQILANFLLFLRVLPLNLESFPAVLNSVNIPPNPFGSIFAFLGRLRHPW